MNDVVQELVDFLNRDPRVEGPIEAHTELVESRRIDSLVIIDLIVFVEERFGVSLSLEDLTPRNLRSMAALAGLISAARGAPRSP
ncbi:MAG TPA: acyl carrier protein [Gemmatimonadota bacterium]|nr:acyl carrier protein [Gemmatimonadota bacterium]